MNATSTTPTMAAAREASRRPAVGIAIPAYRAASTLESTLRSCIAQSLTDWVAVITVDGDDCLAEEMIVAGLNDPRIQVECNGKRLGQGANFNRAIMRCLQTGVRWVKLLSADDLLCRDALERMTAIGESSPECGLVFGFFDGIDRSGGYIFRADARHIGSHVVAGHEFLAEAVPLYNPIGGPSSVMIRSDVFGRCGMWDPNLNFAGDVDFWYRIAETCDVGVVGERTVLSYRFHAESVSGRDGATPKRFSEPIDVMRRFAARQSPGSRLWWAAQICIGRAVSSLCLTAAAIGRRGHYRVAATGIATTLRRLSPLTAPVFVYDFCGRLARRVFRRPLRHRLIPQMLAGDKTSFGPGRGCKST